MTKLVLYALKEAGSTKQI